MLLYNICSDWLLTLCIMFSSFICVVHVSICCSVISRWSVMSDLCDPMDCSTPGFQVLNHLLELAQTHVHWVGDAIQSGNVWREDSYVLSLMRPLSLFKWNSKLLPGTEVIVWGRLGSPLVNILFRTKLLSLIPLSWDMDCVLTLWLTLPLVPLVTVAVRLVFWSLSFPKEVSYTTAYIYS